MKIGIFSPYMDTLGGGERYMLTFAEYCLACNHEVELFWKDKEIVTQATDRFALKLDNLQVNSRLYTSFTADASYASKIFKSLKLPNYDLLFYLSDGSIPRLNARNNWIHFQVPFQLDGTDFNTQQKLTHIKKIICNSDFTRDFIGKSFHVRAETIYPPVSIHEFDDTDLSSKENIILSVGRFDQILNAKRQDVLIQAFKKLVDDGLTNWSLFLVGGLKENDDFLLELRKEAIDYPIEIIPNIKHQDLISLYKKAKIYWHAAGFEIEDDKQPSKVEHFGMSIVEAMAAGCISVVSQKGGIKEIITDKEDGYFWNDLNQLISITSNLVNTQEKQKQLINKARQRAKDFSKERFFTKLDQLFKQIEK
jgi:glycosyltransferase involved in cell wall biosynthesis